MTAAAVALLVYSAQVLLVVAVAAGASALMRMSVPQARLQYWRAVAALCFGLPLLGVSSPNGPAASVTFGTATVMSAVETRPTQAVATFSDMLVWAVAAGVVVRVGWLLLGAWRLRQLRARSVPATLGEEIDALRAALAPKAELRWTEDLAQPASFGLIRPVVLLPRRLAHLSAAAQRAVVCHELAHVARHDWLWIVAEEQARALFWFHPAVWWLLDQLHVSREQVVDQFVVARTGSRKAYMGALLTFADTIPTTAPGVAFVHQRHVVARLAQLSKEAQMSRKRLMCTACALVVIMVAATGVVVSALPLNLGALTAQGVARLEIRLAELEPADGLVAVVTGAGQRIYLHPEVIIDTADVVRANVLNAGGGRYSVSTEFSAEAATRMSTATQGHIGRPVAIVLDGRVIAAPTVRSPIGNSAVITGDFSRDEADTLAAGLTARPASAPSSAQQNGAVDAVSGDDPGVVLPEAISKPQPFYTQEAQDAGIQGVVELTGIVMPDGTVQDVAVTESLDTEYGLDESAAEAVSLWRFKPGTKDGEVVPVRLTFVIRFTLS